MPFYDFKCEECENVFEKLVPNAEIQQLKCPECGSRANRIFSAKGTGFVIKGDNAANGYGLKRNPVKVSREPDGN